MKKKNKTLLLNTAPDKRFWMRDGRVLKNLFELSRAFEEMSEDTYRYHANDSKNDFSNWVSGVFEEQKLAKRLGETKTKEQSQVAVLKHLVSVKTLKR